MYAAPADAGRLSSPAHSHTLPDFLALAEPAPLKLWLAGMDCELPAGSTPKHRMSRAGFYSTNPSRRPIHVRIANKILVLESWSGYLRRLAAIDAATAA